MSQSKDIEIMWIELNDFRCPSCPGEGGKKWVCAKDFDPVLINQLGKIKCSKGTHSGDVYKWGWNCGSSYHNGEYKTADFEGFNFALSQAVQLMGKGGSLWVASLITEIGKQYGKW